MSIPFDDRGLLLGDGLFETLLWKHGALILVHEHWARMAEAARVLGFEAASEDEFRRLGLEAVFEAGLEQGRAAVRLTLTAGSGGRGLDRPDPPAPRLFASAAVSARPTTPARLHVASVRRNEGSPVSRLKTLSYLESVLARREAQGAGADEAVMLNVAGEVASAAASNLFWIRDGALFTPALETGRLDGVMARQVLAAAARLGVPAHLVREGPAALASAEALFLTNSLIGVRAAWLAPSAWAPHALVERLAGEVAAVA